MDFRVTRRTSVPTVRNSTAVAWFRAWSARCRDEGFPKGLDFDDFCSLLRAQGAASMLTFITDKPDHIMYDPRAELIRDLKARLAIADAWLRGELDARPSEEQIGRYSRINDYHLPEAEDEAM